MNGCEIYAEDCIEYMKSLPDNAVDFSFYDPPYNVGKDYGVYKDNLPVEEYVEWMTTVANEVRRVSKNGFAVFVSPQLTRTFFNILPNAHLIPIHKKAAGVLKGGFALQYYSLFVEATPLKRCRDLWDDVRLPGEGYFFKEERFDNPGLTSQALVEKVLEYFTKEDETIFDPFFGVGTTAVVALSMNRNAIGCEINPEYIDIAKERINKGGFYLH